MARVFRDADDVREYFARKIQHYARQEAENKDAIATGFLPNGQRVSKKDCERNIARAVNYQFAYDDARRAMGEIDQESYDHSQEFCRRAALTRANHETLDRIINENSLDELI